MDDDCVHSISVNEFKKGMRDFGVNITESEGTKYNLINQLNLYLTTSTLTIADPLVLMRL